MEVAATGIFKVTEVKLQDFFLQFTELDTRFLNKNFIDLLDFICKVKKIFQ